MIFSNPNNLVRYGRKLKAPSGSGGESWSVGTQAVPSFQGEPFFAPYLSRPFSHTSSSSPGRTGRASSPFSRPPPSSVRLRDTPLVSQWTLLGPRTRLPGPQLGEGSRNVYGRKGRAPQVAPPHSSVVTLHWPHSVPLPG